MNTLQYCSTEGPFEKAQKEKCMEVFKECRNSFTHMIAHEGYMVRRVSSDDYVKLLGLLGYYEQRFNVGMRHFGVFFDDIEMHKAGEGKKFAEEHVKLTVAIYDALRHKDPNTKIIFCPIPYGGPSGEYRINGQLIDKGGNFVFSKKEEALDYLKIIKEKLPKDVYVFWTGSGVFSPTIDAELAKQFGSLIGRKPLIWDNDAARWAQNNEPITGRSKDLHEHTSGYIGLSGGSFLYLPSLLSIAEYTWNPLAYDAKACMQRILHYLAPGKTDDLAKALKVAALVVSPNPQGKHYPPVEEIDRLIGSLKVSITNELFKNELLSKLTEAKKARKSQRY
jgi:hypothetical protein